MSCRISTADLLARIDLGAEQVNEDTFVWEGWVITRISQPVDVSSWTWGNGGATLDVEYR